MSKRIDISKVQPKAIQAMMGVESYLSTSDIPVTLCELIKLRASMINKCAYCIQMHAPVALAHNETEQRLLALSAWEESPLFSETERAVLAMTDEITLISDHGLSDETYQRCLTLLGENVLAQCIMQIITINAWNRFAVSTKMVHEE
ncbi:carboxymuconolactone decarboxylase family protein [Photobacterium sp. OFAV2-7]|uniref:carboxymuconolactone decarboxylase family protein n=1 Tax=Photobacterium sp. OFAV2-7 TaxID=2917748 RepID=UPI001EF54A37|nr:carboxymuconolactone decarboxylase family protein [Photobacterium sp. OFAV2-7]MCG7586314.1 carboxymuconolactone decarboxylase family protein [Photobacterium sp. OFAV2-7]